MNPILTRTGDALVAAIAAEVRVSHDASLLWAVMLEEAYSASRQGVGSRVIARLGWHYSTTISRLLRVGLPSVNTCVDWISLAYAAALFDGPDDRIASIAYTLGHPAASTFNRFVKRRAGIGAREFRDTVPFPVAREWVLDQVVRPYTAQWATFAHVVHRPRYAGPPRSLVAA